jgi:uncharacterized protein with PQ loop repeat
MGFIDAIGALGAVLTTVCWLPQAIQIVRERDTRAISLAATSGFTAGVFLWLVYGVAAHRLAADRLKRDHARPDAGDPRTEAAPRVRTENDGRRG